MAYERRDFAGGAAQTTLSSGIASSGVSSLTVDDASNWPDASSGDFFIVINRGNSNEEKILCSARSGNVLTIKTRGADGTTAAAHAAGDDVEHVITATDADEANYAASETVGKITTKGDLWVGDGTNSADRLAIGSDNQALLAASGQTLGVQWADVAHASLLTAKGDLYVATASATLARLGVGSDGQILEAASGETEGVKWAERPVTTVVKDADESVSSSNTVQNDDELAIALTANEDYAFEAWLHVASGATPGFRFTFTVPTGATISWAAMVAEKGDGSATARDVAQPLTGSGTEQTIADDVNVILIKGSVRVSSTSGNLQFQWAQRASDATSTTVKAGSKLKAALE